MGGGRVAAHEIMRGTPAIRNLIREDKVAQMYSAIQTGQGIGMQTLDQKLTELLKQGLISKEEAFLKAKVVADQFNLPLYCGEFGCFPSTTLEMRSKYYEDIISVFDKLDISWCHWNYKNDFPVVDENSLEPIEMIVSALIK